MTTATTSGKIVGLGLYLELTPNKGADKTTQILFTPEGYDEAGNYVQFAMLSRTVSESSPRKQWRVNFAGIDNNALLIGTTPVVADVATETSKTMTTRFEKSLERFIAGVEGGIIIRQTPIAVEITSLDLAEVREYKAPVALLRRIQKARVSLGFPEKLV